MAETKEATEIPEWGFQIIFDEEKVKKAGYTSNGLYDLLNETIESFGNKRIAKNMWCPIEDAENELFAQARVLSSLSRAPWIMKLISSLPFREDDDEISDYLDSIRKYPIPNEPRVY